MSERNPTMAAIAAWRALTPQERHEVLAVLAVDEHDYRAEGRTATADAVLVVMALLKEIR